MALGDRILARNIRQRIYKAFVSLFGMPNIHAQSRWRAMKPLAKSFSSPVLDLGCNEGYITFEVIKQNPHCLITGVDINADSIAKATSLTRLNERGNIRFLPADATAIPFPDASFATVYCLDVIEHVAEDDAIFKEIARLLKVGGIAILSTTLLPFGKVTEKELYGHVRDGYTLESLYQKFEQHGLEVQSTKYLSNIWGCHIVAFYRFALGKYSLTRLMSIFTFPIFDLLTRLANHLPGEKANILIISTKR